MLQDAFPRVARSILAIDFAAWHRVIASVVKKIFACGGRDWQGFLSMGKFFVACGGRGTPRALHAYYERRTRRMTRRGQGSSPLRVESPLATELG